MLQLTELVTPLIFCLAIHQISSHLCRGHPIALPDLNPVDYEVWGVLQQRVYRSRIRDVDQLKQRLIEKWRCFFCRRYTGCQSRDEWSLRLRVLYTSR